MTPSLMDLHIYGGALLVAVGVGLWNLGAGLVALGALLLLLGLLPGGDP